ncbi:MAG TPA: DUF423 domain-containing protein [Burkholderiaceae bacterium]|nr:DUF423 domain-containing protein [Burkholderiaceae bacterium]
MDRVFLSAGAIFGALAVAAGAFGAHALKAQLPAETLSIFETAARYQMFHALALLASAWAVARWPGRRSSAAGSCFIGGVVLFSGSLYLLSLTGIRGFGAVTPIGGLLWVAGWILLASAPWGARAAGGPAR